MSLKTKLLQMTNCTNVSCARCRRAAVCSVFSSKSRLHC